MKLSYQTVLYGVSFFLFFEAPLMAMHAGTREYNHVEKALGTVPRLDPPFFKLVTKGRRELYILGSIHNKHPDLLLPAVVIAEITRLARNGAIYYTEHAPTSPGSGAGILRGWFLGISSASSDRWDPIAEFRLTADEIAVWNSVKEIDLNTSLLPGIKLEHITKVDIAKGVMCLQQFVSQIAKLKGKPSSNFEEILKTKGWRAQENLEQLVDAINDIALVPEDVGKFFKASLSHIKKINDYENEITVGHSSRAWDMLVMDYKASIKQYQYDYSATGVKASTKARNSKWKDELMGYLSRSSSTDPILIVVGNAHLKGALTPGSGSFLEHLHLTTEFISIERMEELSGAWVPVY